MKNQFRELAKTLENAVERSAAFDVQFGRYSLSDCEVDVEFTTIFDNEDSNDEEDDDCSFYDDRIGVYLTHETYFYIYEEHIELRYISCILEDNITIDSYEMCSIDVSESLITIELQGGTTVKITIKGESNE